LEVVEEKYSIPLRKKVHDFEHAIMQVPDHNPRGEEYNKALQKAENLYHAFIGHLRELARITFDVELMNLRMMAKNEVTNQMRLNLAKLKHIPYSFGGLIKKLSEDYYLGRELDLYVNDDVQGVLNALYKSPFDYVDAIKKLDEKLKGGHAKAKNIADALKKSIESAKGKSKKEKKEKKDKKD
uniref:DUF3847 domain-containing protein n=2 Tax=Bursaphelenchus xylophilus TaxID=6326 RepID=A0A1I7SHB7_BURXY